jgi:hypothetical protein
MLAVDRSASAASPEPSAISAWAATQRVFISSVMTGMADERRAVADAVEQIGAEPVMFETFGGRDADPENAYLGEVAASDIYVGILGRMYGRLLTSRRSATHEEYREAEQRGLRISVWTTSPEDWSGDQQDFVDEVRLFHVTGRYETAAALQDALTTRLRRMAAEELTPWVKLGSSFDEGLLFRAREIRDEGRQLQIVCEIKNPDVVTGLEALRGGTFGSWRGRFTWSGGSTPVRVRNVSSRWSTSRTARVTIDLDRDEAPGGEPIGQMTVRVATGNYSPDDITELALKHVLFGEPHPLGLMGFMAKIDNPIASLQTLALPDETLRPVCSLLFTEALVGPGRATRVTGVRLGVPIAGQRRLEIEWQPPARSGTMQSRRSIQGVVDL